MKSNDNNFRFEIVNSKLVLTILLLAVGTVFSCKKNEIFKDDELSIPKTNYSGNELRIDGYYYETLNSSYFSLYCFYGNGTLLANGGVFLSIQEMNDYIIKEFINSKEYKDYKSNWGVFKIEGNNIQFERWYPSDPPLKAFIKEGEIINDTTFIITQVYRMKDNKKIEASPSFDIYHFKQFSPKPDSTNTFIK